MIAAAWKRWTKWWSSELLSPRWLALWAARLAVLFVVVHLLGLRDCTTVLSGTFASGNVVLSGFLGFFYIVAWFGFVLGTPALLFGAGTAWALDWGLRFLAARASGAHHR